jgi:hypothetical protein
MSSSGSLLLSIASGLGAIVAVGFGIAFLVLTLTTVRMHRPDASGMLTTAAALYLADVTLVRALYWVGPMLILRSSGMEDYQAFLGAVNMLGTMFHVAWMTTLLLGLVRIARPPPQPSLPYQPPFR